jgi:hypothetical protein
MNAVRRFFPVFLMTGLLLTSAGAVTHAQTLARGAQAEPSEPEAKRTRSEFMGVLKQYPPAVGAVLKLDPSLIASDTYLVPYPALTAFLAKHPEVKRSPAYYLNQVPTSSDNDYNLYYGSEAQAWNNMQEMMGVGFVMIAVFGTLIWLVRTAVDYRRWGRLAKVQAEAHTKLLDRFTANEELLAYVQSSAGARFLKSAPISLDGNPRAMGAPLSRILWSMQAGVVLAFAGIGMNYVSRTIETTRAEPMFFFSVVLLSLGLGFFVSAGLSYMLSKRLGLFPTEATADRTDE